MLWLTLGRVARGQLLRKLGGLLTMLDSVGVEFRVNEELCFKLKDCPNEMTKRKCILVSRT
jgi:hypothetical protein